MLSMLFSNNRPRTLRKCFGISYLKSVFKPCRNLLSKLLFSSIQIHSKVLYFSVRDEVVYDTSIGRYLMLLVP